ncbi:MAG: sulfotransferase [Deltaproteobacteria bacterium]|nr:sulfotransferase [Deltaproteobacteria bacterium]
MHPLFIGGCERSGTTLLGAMLGSHREYLCVPEMQFKFDICRLAAADHEDAVDASALLRAVGQRSSFRIWELGLDEPMLPQQPMTCRELMEWLVQLYGKKVNKPTPRFWVDHTPKNIRYARTLFQCFPDAKMLHIVRDGRAVEASVLPLDWGPNTIENAARFWAECLAYGFAAEIRWPRQVIRVRYEDLVRDPHHTLQSVCTALAIPFDPIMSEVRGFQVPPYTANQHSLTGHRPNPTRVNSWERNLSSRQIEIFESLTTDLLTILGYEPRFGLAAQKATRREILTADIQELYKKSFSNRRRKRQRKIAAIPRAATLVPLGSSHNQ